MRKNLTCNRFILHSLSSVCFCPNSHYQILIMKLHVLKLIKELVYFRYFKRVNSISTVK